MYGVYGPWLTAKSTECQIIEYLGQNENSKQNFIQMMESRWQICIGYIIDTEPYVYYDT